MRTRSPLTAGLVFIGIAAILLYWQVSSDRLATGLVLAAAWALSGVAIPTVGSSGAWLGALVAALSLIGAGWTLVLASGGQGREIAEALFASSGGFFSWADVAIIAVGLALLFLLALVLVARVLLSNETADTTDGV